MRILVIGLNGATPELLFGDERLTNFRRLMEFGCYGRLESVIPPSTVPAWMCMAASQDPGSLGVYGSCSRPDHSYASPRIVSSESIQAITIWDQVAREGEQTIIIDVPPSCPPRKVNGISVGCPMTHDHGKQIYTYPAYVQEEIASILGEYSADATGVHTRRKDRDKDEIYAMSRKQFEVVQHLLQLSEWGFFQFVEMGIDRLQRSFWQYHDPHHLLHKPSNPYQEVIRDYYLHLDSQVGRILELLSEDTVILVVSAHGAQRLDGGFCVNEWLLREDLLALNQHPKEVTPFHKLDVNWERTKAWAEGGCCARVFLNVKGREPKGIIEQAEYEAFRDELRANFETTVDGQGNPLGTLVFKPEELYQTVRNIAPDLIVHLGGLRWRAIDEVGHPSIWVQEDDASPHGCNLAQFGGFILAAPNSPVQGMVEGAHLLDMAPTLLQLGGYDIPNSMQGRSLVAGRALEAATDMGLSEDEEEIIRQRLSGLGYIS